jgi:hypothetical protein
MRLTRADASCERDLGFANQLAGTLIEDGHVSPGQTYRRGSQILDRDGEAGLRGWWWADANCGDRILSQQGRCETKQEDQYDCGTGNEFHGLFFEGLVGKWAIYRARCRLNTGVVRFGWRRQEESAFGAQGAK